MITTMHAAPGVGLAAPQVGVQKRLFVYDIGDGADVLVNPVIDESRGEWTFEEGCLSVPELSWPIVRPKEVHLTGFDLDGNEVSVEADGHDVLLVVCRPDKRRGRGGALLPSPVKAAALELGLPVTDKVDDVVDAGADLAVVVAFGRLIKKPVLDAVPMVNMHFSLLPR